MKRLTTGCLIVLLAATGVGAGIGGGLVEGPDGGFSINMVLQNSPASTSDIVSAAIDGTSASPNVFVWDSIFGITVPPGASVTPSGDDTSLLTLTFGDLPDGFNPGESVRFSLDPDTTSDPSYGAKVSELIGVEVLFGFRDASTWRGVFVDDPAQGAGLILQQVPVPAAAFLGMIGLSFAGWRLRRSVL